ncbi:hypothetical protein [Streptomyces griseofuscus]|uniref:hypothetical protein n=1 Tax=Streptomyces griseofuscus TaxID=146922 RepID=UPI0034541423
MFVTAHNRAQQDHSPLILAGLNNDLMRVFHIVGLDQIFTFQPTVHDAVNAPYVLRAVTVGGWLTDRFRKRFELTRVGAASSDQPEAGGRARLRFG